MDRVAYVGNQLSTFKDSLTLYQEQKNWDAKVADKSRRAAGHPKWRLTRSWCRSAQPFAAGQSAQNSLRLTRCFSLKPLSTDTSWP
jgi:hypothetical protein